MFSLAILLIFIVIMTISFNIPEVVLSAPSICGILLAAFFIFFIVSKIVSRFRPQPV